MVSLYMSQNNLMYRIIHNSPKYTATERTKKENRAPPYKTRQIKFLLHKDLNIIQ